MIDKEYSIENQQKRANENLQLKMNKEKFKKLLKSSSFTIIPKWHLKKEDIDLNHLGNERHRLLNSSNDYSIYCIKRLELFRILDSSFERVFKKNNLWTEHWEDKITKVLVNWEKSIKLIPPVLILDLSKENLLIQDGKHRFAVANYFEIETIPIIILNIIEKRFLELADKKCIKKLTN